MDLRKSPSSVKATVPSQEEPTHEVVLKDQL